MKTGEDDMPLSKTIQELREMDRHGTPSPWEEEDGCIWIKKEGVYVVPPDDMDRSRPLVVDTRLIASMRNNLHVLLAAATWALENGYYDK